ncbi:MAG TPA: hypothetical protein VF171_01735 [Trueperaceae bacterium]
MPYTSAQRTALLALQGGELRLEGGRWLIVGERHAQEVPYRMVQWLLGERLVEVAKAGHPRTIYRLSAKGLHTSAETQAEVRSRELQWRQTSPLQVGPLLLLRPAHHSEDLDHILVVPMGSEAISRHRERLAQAQTAQRAEPEHFEFIQYRADVFALPIDHALTRQGMLPSEEQLFLLRHSGFRAPERVGARWCPDRGVNYGAHYVQWFGGFDEEEPLIISPKLDLDIFRALLDEVEELL